MENYRKSAHCTYDIKYHLVWITKYRKPAISGQIALRTRELIRMICQSNEVEILAGHVGSDHIHLLVSVPPHLSASKLVQYIKGNTSRKLQMEYKELNRQFWGQHLWARGYFVASSGNVTIHSHFNFWCLMNSRFFLNFGYSHILRFCYKPPNCLSKSKWE